MRQLGRRRVAICTREAEISYSLREILRQHAFDAEVLPAGATELRSFAPKFFIWQPGPELDVATKFREICRVPLHGLLLTNILDMPTTGALLKLRPDWTWVPMPVHPTEVLEWLEFAAPRLGPPLKFPVEGARHWHHCHACYKRWVHLLPNCDREYPKQCDACSDTVMRSAP